MLVGTWTAYNDCVASATGNAPNTTAFDKDNPSGTLLDISDGSTTSVSVLMEALNISPWNSDGMPAADTDAYNTFNGILNLNENASYGDGTSDWYYQVTFSGLNPAKSYAFVTMANRNGSYDPARWTKFTIIGADTYSNFSSTGVTKVSEDVLKLNSGENTATGYVVAWTDITAADGIFTVRSENVGDEGLGEPYKSYGLQGFKLVELAP